MPPIQTALASLTTHTLEPLTFQHAFLSKKLDTLNSTIYNAIHRFLYSNFPNGEPPLSSWVSLLPRYHYNTQWGLSSSLKTALLSHDFVSNHPHLSFSSILNASSARTLLSPHLLDNPSTVLPDGWFLLYCTNPSPSDNPSDNPTAADIVLLKIA